MEKPRFEARPLGKYRVVRPCPGGGGMDFLVEDRRWAICPVIDVAAWAKGNICVTRGSDHRTTAGGLLTNCEKTSRTVTQLR